MNQPFKSTYLTQYFLFFRQNQGFTLIELLVVVIIVGVLAAVALPNLFSQIGKAREAEGKQILSSLSNAQQAYFVEKGTFSDSLDKLDRIVNSKHFNVPDPTLVTPEAVKQQIDAIDAANKNVRNYSQGVYYNGNNRTFSVTLCQSATPKDTALAPDTNTGTCTNGDIIR